MKFAHHRDSFILTIAAILLVACAALPKSDPHNALDTAPEAVRSPRVEEAHMGETLQIPLPDRVTVLDFRTSHCPPCIEAIPKLEALWQRVDQSRVAVIGVSADEDEGVTISSIGKAGFVFSSTARKGILRASSKRSRH